MQSFLHHIANARGQHASVIFPNWEQYVAHSDLFGRRFVLYDPLYYLTDNMCSKYVP